MRAFAITLFLTACWRDTATPPASPEPAPIVVRTPAPEPTGVDEAAPYIEQAEAAFERGDLAAAATLYGQALASPTSPLVHYARYKLGWVEFNLGRVTEALDLFVSVAQGATDENLRKAAGDDSARVYAQVGKPAVARAFFKRIDPLGTNRRLEILADAYDMAGKASEAATVRAQITP
jgi:tetratricopeptide (TPR) repeat protein